MSFKRFETRSGLLVLVASLVMTLVFSSATWGQTLTTGAITGTVTDPSGAVVPSASVALNSEQTGVKRTATTGSNGSYTFAQLNPGNYMVTVNATGFNAATMGPVAVAVSQTAQVDFQLRVGAATQTVEVTGAAVLLQTSNPNTTTTLNAQAISELPNPGSDLTFEAQVAPGALMNSSGGYGNVEFNGLPSGSNNFTIDGLDANDPFLNLNNSGATNLQLGLSAIDEVSVNTTSYSVDQGRMSAAQINYTTKSGTNQFHGSAFEIWNGSHLNSADFFTNAAGNKKPRSNVNQFAGSVGGPIKKDKLFFFVDLEGTRIVVPVVENNIAYPSSAYQNYVLTQALPNGGNDPIFGRDFPAQPAEVPFYQNMFSLYGNQTGTPVADLGCPFDVGGGTPATANDGNGCVIHRTFSLSNHAKETLFTVKVDHNVNDSNSVWYRFQMDNGTQPTSTDPINPIFNAISIQPERNANAGWTHTFGPTIVNQFNPGFAWYSAIFKPLSLSKTLAAFPITYFSDFQGLGGIDFVWPQGRNVTQWQLNDNLSWSKGKHDLKFGENMRRVLVSDHDFGFFNTPLEIAFDLPAFTFGAADLSIQNFPKTLDEPIGIVNLDMYAMDTYKATPKLTLTLGVRATWNADPVNQQGLYSRPTGSFYSLPHDVTRPLNQDLHATSLLFPSTQRIFWQPRGAIAYQFLPKTVFRAGFGVFSDIFPASLADSIAQNPPFDPQFNAGPFGSLANGGFAVAPGVPNSVVDAAVAANAAFQAGFSGGALSCAAPGAPANCIPAVGLTAVPDGQYQYPYSLQWSAAIERQLTNTWVFKVQYVGTRQVHTPYTVQPNGFQTMCDGCFSPWPFNTPPDARFGGVTQYVAGAGSNYNGLQFNTTKRLSHGLMFNINYTYSHCLDEISNGGIFGFGGPSNILSPIPGELRRQYGNCDYDVRHAMNGNYVYNLPFHSSRGWLNQVVGGWEVSGTAFLRGGFPFSVQSQQIGSFVLQGGGWGFANQVPGVNPYSQFKNISGVTQSGQVQWFNPAAFTSVIDPSTTNCTAGETFDSSGNVLTSNNSPQTCQYGTLGRNTLRAPHFRWSDFFLTKRFKLSERVALRVDGQFYNVFNHPNFTYPSSVSVGVPAVPSTLTGLGTISSEVTPPTGLLGSFLGGDNAVRMISLSGRIEF
jgi:carboxypeptidase family protein